LMGEDVTELQTWAAIWYWRSLQVLLQGVLYFKIRAKEIGRKNLFRSQSDQKAVPIAGLLEQSPFIFVCSSLKWGYCSFSSQTVNWKFPGKLCELSSSPSVPIYGAHRG
jgi:hypothetical protein